MTGTEHDDDDLMRYSLVTSGVKWFGDARGQLLELDEQLPFNTNFMATCSPPT